MTESDTQIHKGLAGVVVDTTEVSSVDAESNSLLYRGYPVQQLAAHALVRGGRVPAVARRAARRRPAGGPRRRPDGRSGCCDDAVVDAVLALPTTCHPMDVVRTAVSVIGAHDPTEQDSSREANLAKSVHLLAQIPGIVALDQRRRRGQDPVAPRDDLGFAENFLWMTFGEVPDPVVVHAFEVSMILYAEHSFNASTFTARVIASTLSDLHSAVVGAIGALKGPLHGGANEAVMATFAEIGTADRAAAWLDDALGAQAQDHGLRPPRLQARRLPRADDARVAGRPSSSTTTGRTCWTCTPRSRRAMTERKNILPNLDYPTGPAYHLMGFDTPTFTPLFVASRITGWTAHVMEQLGANSLIRPLSRYVGPARRDVP